MKDQNRPILLTSPSSWTSPVRNSSQPILVSSPLKTTTQMPPLFWEMFQTESTGDHKEPLDLSRTKANADHAGHSQPLVPSKDFQKSKEVACSHSVSNNSLIALAEVNGATKDATEVGIK